MLLSQFLLQTLVFPYMLDDGLKVAKTIISSFILIWVIFCIIVKLLGPGTLKSEENVSLMTLLDEFEPREVCPTCKVI